MGGHFIFDAKGQEMMLVIDEKSLAKKNENFKILKKFYVMYLKKKLRRCSIQIQFEKI